MTTARETSISLMAVIDGLMFMDAPPEVFLHEMLAFQRELTGANQAALMRVSGEQVELILIHPTIPKDMPVPAWIQKALEQALKASTGHQSVVIPLHEKDALYDQSPNQCIIALPCLKQNNQAHVIAFLFNSGDPAVINQLRVRLELTIALPGIYELNQKFHGQTKAMHRMDTALQVSSNVNEPEKFKSVAMALCNELASRLNADRVSLGFLKGKYIKVQAISHTEKFTRKMKLTQDLEAAMEECLDQDTEVIYPPFKDAPYVYRSTTEHAHQHGPMCIISIPIRHEAEPFAVLLLERNPELPFQPEEFQTLRLICELVATRLYERERVDQWFGARWLRQSRDIAAMLIGPKYTWIKLAAMLVLVTVIIFAVAKGEDRVESTFNIQSSTRYVVPVPFSATLDTVKVSPGDTVEEGMLLARLNTLELHERLVDLTQELNRYETEQRVALKEGKTAELQIAQARYKSTAAQIELLQFQINQAELRAREAGMILSGDWKRKIGQPMTRGDLMFEIGPDLHNEAELAIPEDRIADVIALLERKPISTPAQPNPNATTQGASTQAFIPEAPVIHGYLSPAASPDLKIPFQIVRVNPVAEVVAQNNVFRVQVRLLEHHEKIRPGMQGVAKIDIGQKLYIKIWTRDLVNWLRMQLWI